jgi:trehalose-6-phosphatase
MRIRTLFFACITSLHRGDGKTDESLFSFLSELDHAVTVTVGKKQTEAKYYLEGVRDVEQLMLDFCNACV